MKFISLRFAFSGGCGGLNTSAGLEVAASRWMDARGNLVVRQTLHTRSESTCAEQACTRVFRRLYVAHNEPHMGVCGSLCEFENVQFSKENRTHKSHVFTQCEQNDHAYRQECYRMSPTRMGPFTEPRPDKADQRLDELHLSVKREKNYSKNFLTVHKVFILLSYTRLR